MSCTDICIITLFPIVLERVYCDALLMIGSVVYYIYHAPCNSIGGRAVVALIKSE